jgi:hypothetical protein
MGVEIFLESKLDSLRDDDKTICRFTLVDEYKIIRRKERILKEFS